MGLFDRSKKAIDQAKRNSRPEVASGRLNFIQVNIEEFDLPEKENKFDIAFAIRVGALDGRHPESERESLKRIARALKKNGRLFIDGGNPLREISLKR